MVVYTLIMQRAFIFCLVDFSEANLPTAKSSHDHLNFFHSHPLYPEVCNYAFQKFFQTVVIQFNSNHFFCKKDLLTWVVSILVKCKDWLFVATEF